MYPLRRFAADYGWESASTSMWFSLSLEETRANSGAKYDFQCLGDPVVSCELVPLGLYVSVGA